MRAYAASAALLVLLAAAPQTGAIVPPPLFQDPPILAVHEPGDATLTGLAAAGYTACPPGQGGDCVVAMTASDFATATLGDYRAIFVGTHEGTGPVYAALVARASDIDAFVDAGGSLVTLAEPTTGDYAFVPNDASWPFYMIDTDPSEVAWVTDYGTTHPALVGIDNATIEGWGPSFQRFIGERPFYMGEVLRGEAVAWNWSMPGTVGLAGNWGDGCVFVTLLQADRAASGLHDPTRAGDAADLIEAVMEWALDCSTQPPFPIAFGGAIRIFTDTQTGVPTSWHSANLLCGPLTLAGGEYSVECQPGQSPPPYAYYACVGSALVAWHVRLADLHGRSECGGGINAQCTTPTQGTPSTLHGWCADMSGFDLGPFPLRCVAKPGAPRSIQPAWSVNCGNTDP